MDNTKNYLNDEITCEFHVTYKDTQKQSKFTVKTTLNTMFDSFDPSHYSQIHCWVQFHNHDMKFSIMGLCNRIHELEQKITELEKSKNK
jgi:hypothetical protein